MGEHPITEVLTDARAGVRRSLAPSPETRPEARVDTRFA